MNLDFDSLRVNSHYNSIGALRCHTCDEREPRYSWVTQLKAFPYRFIFEVNQFILIFSTLIDQFALRGLEACGYRLAPYRCAGCLEKFPHLGPVGIMYGPTCQDCGDGETESIYKCTECFSAKGFEHRPMAECLNCHKVMQPQQHCGQCDGTDLKYPELPELDVEFENE